MEEKTIPFCTPSYKKTCCNRGDGFYVSQFFGGTNR